ncbi:MAG: metal-sulfur cluster assembly factor [Thermodesulfobacteriota bacterium]
MAMKKLPMLQDQNPTENDGNVSITKFEHAPESDHPVELTETSLLDALSEVVDPELPVDIVSLGLIYDLGISGRNVHIKMTLTTPGCGMGKIIAQQAEEALKSAGAKEVLVEIVWDPPWNPDMMTLEAKERLGAG